MLSEYYTNCVTIMKTPLKGNGMKNKVVLPYGLLCFMLFVLTHALAQSPQDRGAAGGHPNMRSSRGLLDLEKAIKVIPKQRLQESRTIKYPDYDAGRYPILEYTIDTAHLGYMEVGEPIPDEILDMPLWVVNDANGIDTTTLRELNKTEYLVLDVWANYCAPCIVSMNKWESRKEEIKDRITVVGIHLDYDYKALESAKQRKWSSTQIIGKAGYILSRYLCGTLVMGPSIWIKDGRLFGISEAGNYEEDFVGQLLRGEIQEIPEYAKFKLPINR